MARNIRMSVRVSGVTLYSRPKFETFLIGLLEIPVFHREMKHAGKLIKSCVMFFWFTCCILLVMSRRHCLSTNEFSLRDLKK